MTRPSLDEWIREAKAAPEAQENGMYLFHNGVVRAAPKAVVRFGEERKYREIADELGISEVAVYKHLVAALARIKNHFNT